MESVQKYTTLWRITCSFQTKGIDYRDYVRGKKQELDVITFQGSDICKKVEYLNIRGHNCSRCTAIFYQTDLYSLYIDSRSTYCDFDGSSGAAYSEDNFGSYIYINLAFRCTENQESTTGMWFGDYI